MNEKTAETKPSAGTGTVKRNGKSNKRNLFLDNSLRERSVIFLWVVRFIRKDGKPDEEYFYLTFSDAEYHRRLFENDSSDLYERIEVVEL